MSTPFRVGYTHDFLKADGSIGWGDIGMAQYEGIPDLEVEFLPEHPMVLPAELAQGYDALGVLAPRITADLLDNSPDLVLIARFGVGYDSVDCEAATRNGIAVSITPVGVRRAMASTALALLLGAAHRIVEKDRITRAGLWGTKLEYMGFQITGKTLGMIGLGGIAREFLHLIAPFEMPVLAYDPYITTEQAADVGALKVDLETLLSESDYVVIVCNLTPETFHLMNAERFAQMKPTAILINIARGPIVEESALYDALSTGQLRYAATDVFETEPPDPSNPLFSLDNIIVTPHALGWTEESAMGIGTNVIESVLAVREGRAPATLANPAVVDSPIFQQKLANLKARLEG
ncbi:MAG TPA: NAD(P)-dependent oxidoreductase [Thermomicrobiales bacterium]|nr:NAD(P)-dependent oxidoreductase [Thermomicrobiales bacterium]